MCSHSPASKSASELAIRVAGAAAPSEQRLSAATRTANGNWLSSGMTGDSARSAKLPVTDRVSQRIARYRAAWSNRKRQRVRAQGEHAHTAVNMFRLGPRGRNTRRAKGISRLVVVDEKANAMRPPSDRISADSKVIHEMGKVTAQAQRLQARARACQTYRLVRAPPAKTSMVCAVANASMVTVASVWRMAPQATQSDHARPPPTTT